MRPNLRTFSGPDLRGRIPRLRRGSDPRRYAPAPTGGGEAGHDLGMRPREDLATSQGLESASDPDKKSRRRDFQSGPPPTETVPLAGQFLHRLGSQATGGRDSAP